MENELPADLSGRDVLSIGVGAGAELSRLLALRPGRVTAIDLSRVLLAIASTRHPGVRCVRMDMRSLAFRDEAFDFVYSSLAFHYAEDWDRLLAEVHRVLRPGGTLLASTHHPGYWGRKAATGRTHTNRRGVVLTEHVATLPAANVEVVYYNHRDEPSIADAFAHAGFALDAWFAPQVVELPAVEYAALGAAERDDYEALKLKNSPRPLFLVVRATRTRTGPSPA